MSVKIKTAIVQYMLMHLSVEAIRSKLKHFHSYMISRQGLYIFITVAILQRTQKYKKQKHTFAIIFNRYNQLYNMQYSKV